MIARIREARVTGGAVGGLHDVLTTLEQDRVHTVLLARGATLAARLCPCCGQLSTSVEDHCRLDGSALVATEATEHVVELAARRSVQVVVVRRELAALPELGSIAALLRT